MENKTCKEYWDIIPFKSEHIFDTDGFPHYNPTNCIKCGKLARQWEDEILEKAKDMPEVREIIRNTLIHVSKLSDVKIL